MAAIAKTSSNTIEIRIHRNYEIVHKHRVRISRHRNEANAFKNAERIARKLEKRIPKEPRNVSWTNTGLLYIHKCVKKHANGNQSYGYKVRSDSLGFAAYFHVGTFDDCSDKNCKKTLLKAKQYRDKAIKEVCLF
jgi:hypothetical protein